MVFDYLQVDGLLGSRLCWLLARVALNHKRQMNRLLYCRLYGLC
jgi:hypothetical protein